MMNDNENNTSESLDSNSIPLESISSDGRPSETLDQKRSFSKTLGSERGLSEIMTLGNKLSVTSDLKQNYPEHTDLNFANSLEDVEIQPSGFEVPVTEPTKFSFSDDTFSLNTIRKKIKNKKKKAQGPELIVPELGVLDNVLPRGTGYTYPPSFKWFLDELTFDEKLQKKSYVKTNNVISCSELLCDSDIEEESDKEELLDEKEENLQEEVNKKIGEEELNFFASEEKVGEFEEAEPNVIGDKYYDGEIDKGEYYSEFEEKKPDENLEIDEELLPTPNVLWINLLTEQRKKSHVIMGKLWELENDEILYKSCDAFQQYDQEILDNNIKATLVCLHATLDAKAINNNESSFNMKLMYEEALINITYDIWKKTRRWIGIENTKYFWNHLFENEVELDEYLNKFTTTLIENGYTEHTDDEICAEEEFEEEEMLGEEEKFNDEEEFYFEESVWEEDETKQNLDIDLTAYEDLLNVTEEEKGTKVDEAEEEEDDDVVKDRSTGPC